MASVEIYNKEEIKRIKFSPLLNNSKYKSISDAVIFKIKVTTDVTLNWAGIKLKLDDIANTEIFYWNDRRQQYHYPNTPIRNGQVISISVKFKSTESIDILINHDFSNLLYFKKNINERYLEYDYLLSFAIN